MKSQYSGLVVAVALSLLLGQPLRADTFVFRVDDLLDDSISAELLQNGKTVFTHGGDPEVDDFTFGGFTPPTTAAVDLRANILEPVSGLLSDTYMVTAPANSSLFTYTLISDTEGV